MELLLNLVWLVVAASLSVVWRTRWLPRACAGVSVSDERSLRDRKRQSLVGLICVLAFLFPAISLTDDLHPAVVTLSDTKSIYAVAHGHNPGSASPQPHSPAPGFAGLARVSRIQLSLSPHDSPLACGEIAVPNDCPCGLIPGRAPPLLS
ncbi:MAG TPA: hypothetical protein VMB02_07850 [Candidatus Aquilonibacter sp.]|nr:hypothetical protein [Candidatus Aquilonibacter sp.]